MTEAKHDAPAQGAGDGDGKAVRAARADMDALEARKGSWWRGSAGSSPGAT